MHLIKIPKTLSSGNVFRKLKSQQAKKKYKENHERNKGTGRFENGNICLLRSRSKVGFQLALDLSALEYLKSLCR